MAIYRGLACILLEEHLQRPFSGRLLQLGRQEVWFSLSEFRDLMKERAYEPANRSILDSIADPDRPLTDREFFGALGFSEVDSVDVYEATGATVILDLNQDETPLAHIGKFDCVLDGGTMEHVFHVQNVLRHIFSFLKVGGRVIHVNPSSNSVDHGFYSLSPCFYLEYYAANDFRMDACKLLDLGTKLKRIRVTGYDCLEPLPRDIVDGFLPGCVHHVFFAGAKGEKSTCGRIPQQGVYEANWGGKTRQSGSTVSVSPARPGAFAALKEAIKRRPKLNRAVRRYATPFLRLWTFVECRRMLRERARIYE